jgi:hypothetical protein
MKEHSFENYLMEILNDHMEDGFIEDFETFETKGLLTNNCGVVVSITDGSEFQLQIVKSK